ADELGPRDLDVVDDEVRSLDRARRGGRDSLAELDGGWRARRCHLHHPPVRTVGEIGVQPPPPALVETLGAVDIGHRKNDDLELGLDRRGARGLHFVLAAYLSAHSGLFSPDLGLTLNVRNGSFSTWPPRIVARMGAPSPVRPSDLGVGSGRP